MVAASIAIAVNAFGVGTYPAKDDRGEIECEDMNNERAGAENGRYGE